MEDYEGQFLSILQRISQSFEKKRNLSTFSATCNEIFSYEDFKRGSHTRSFALNLFRNGVAIIFRKNSQTYNSTFKENCRLCSGVNNRPSLALQLGFESRICYVWRDDVVAFFLAAKVVF